MELKQLQNYEVILWDFDGVIKESLSVKAEAFVALFNGCSGQILDRILKHHLENGGLSRFVKIPMYMSWAGITVNHEQIQIYCKNFGNLVFEMVVQSPWVPGVKSYLSNNSKKQKFYLLSATPQEEMINITKKLNIFDYFCEIFGAPLDKADTISSLIMSLANVDRNNLIMIGDSRQDLMAASKNNIDFLLRCTSFNKNLQASYSGPKINNFLSK
jgi:phosphoglycolate phosphatase-like HAD superfamily hydrolase